MRKIAHLPLIVQCGHCPDARIAITEVTEGLPRLDFQGMNSEGSMVLSNKTIVLTCRDCRRDIDIIVAEHGKTIVLQ